LKTKTLIGYQKYNIFIIINIIAIIIIIWLQVEVERIRSKAHDKLMDKLAAARHKAEEKRAAAEANRNHQAAKTEEQADYIRRTGHVPSSYLSFSCCNWCS